MYCNSFCIQWYITIAIASIKHSFEHTEVSVDNDLIMPLLDLKLSITAVTKFRRGFTDRV